MGLIWLYSCLEVCEGPRMTTHVLHRVVHCCVGVSRCFEQADGPCRCQTSAVDQRVPGRSGTAPLFIKHHRNCESALFLIVFVLSMTSGVGPSHHRHTTCVQQDQIQGGRISKPGQVIV